MGMEQEQTPHKRRVRYKGKYPKKYEEKYKAEVVVDGENFKSIINYEQDTLLNLEYELMTNEHIELLEILTKEQFEQMSHKVGE